MFFMARISIIVPVYNVEAYLEECVNSVLKQTFTDLEIILIDDGSVDKSGAICDELALHEARIRVVHQKNKGLSAARNIGVSLATGEYIIFLDSDDFWKNMNVLNALVQRIEETYPDVLSFNYVKYDGTHDFCPYFPNKDMPRQTAGMFSWMAQHGVWIACAWNKIIKRSLFDNGDLRFIEGITSEDMDWCVRLALKAERFDYISEVVVCYRQRDTSISHASTPEKVGTVLSNIERCIALLQSSNCGRSELLKSFVGYQYGTALFHLSSLTNSKKRDEQVARAKDLRYLLKWSNNRKIKLLDIAISLLGLNAALLLLKFRK